MNKSKFYLMTALVALLLTAGAVAYQSKQKECECFMYQKYTEVTLHPDATFESSEDSICVLTGHENGDMIMKKFKEETPKSKP